MALPTITTSDFDGLISTNQNSFRSQKQQIYIDTLYPTILDELIGIAATTEIQNQLVLEQKWIDLFDGATTYFNLLEGNLLRMPNLLGIVKKVMYFYWVRDDSINTTSGQSINSVQNADMLDRNMIASDVRQRYNAAMAAFNYYVIAFLDNYKDYKSSITAVNDLGGFLLEIVTTDTIYLKDSDKVTIEGTEYVISDLIANTSFRITGSFVTNPTKFIYNPYKIVKYCHQIPILF